MKLSSSGRQATLRAGAFFALLAAWAFGTSTASATCGDYVTSRAQREAHARMGGQAMPGSGHEMMPDAPRRDRPCSGPTCSDRRGVPDAPIPPSVTIQTETWCDTTWLPRCFTPEPVADLFDHPLRWPSPFAATPIRPPRSPSFA